MIIPFRVITAIIGLILGYSAGTYVEILYEKQGDYRHEVAALLTGIKYGAWDTSGDCFSSCDDDIIFFDQALTNSSDEDTSDKIGRAHV